MNSHFYQRIIVLCSKEFLRLKRNPAALMSVGLIILMALLVSLENTASKIEKQKEQVPCAIMYQQDSKLIEFLRQDKQASRYQFTKAEHAFDANHYDSQLRCVAEIVENQDAKSNISIIFRAIDIKSEQMGSFSRWLLANVAMQNNQIDLTQSLVPLVDKKPAKTMGSIDLGSNQAKAMIGAMMIFSAQYFLCCALFISFTGHEKERGILQGIALTTTSPTEILLSKVIFHTTLSVIASLVITMILAPAGIKFVLTFFDYLLMLFIFSSFGFIAIATIIVSLNRSQSTAGLVGFCYLMLMGVIFALANKFKAFALIKAWMFEGRAIDLFAFWLNPPISKDQFNPTAFNHALLNYVGLIGLSMLLLIIALIIFRKKGWASH